MSDKRELDICLTSMPRNPVVIRRSSSIPDYYKIKRNLYNIQEGRCFYCNRKIKITGSHIDHILPRCKNGGNEHGNLCLSCVRCNSCKGGFSLGRWLYKLRKTCRCKGKDQYTYWKKWTDSSRLQVIKKVNSMTENVERGLITKPQCKEKKVILSTWQYKERLGSNGGK